MDDALKIVTDNNFCIKCHLLGDFAPKGTNSAKAPQLGDVYHRLRPDYVLDWIANPKRILPYTGMPVNIPVGQAGQPGAVQGRQHPTARRGGRLAAELRPVHGKPIVDQATHQAAGSRQDERTGRPGCGAIEEDLQR